MEGVGLEAVLVVLVLGSRETDQGQYTGHDAGYPMLDDHTGLEDDKG